MTQLRALGLVLYLAAFLMQAMTQGELYEGSPCVDSRGAAGVCVALQRCAPGLQTLREGGRPRICSFVAFKPIVCCIGAASTNTTGAASTTNIPITTTTGAASTNTIGAASTTNIPTTSSSRSSRTASVATTASTPAAGSSGSKSSQKCEEWGRSVFRMERLPVATVPNAPLVNRSHCSLKAGQPFILGGSNAERHEFPHMAAIGFGNEPRIGWWCGGSLISERFVLTAAHCLKDLGTARRRAEGPARWVRLGEHNLASAKDDTTVQVIAVESLHPHPGYAHDVKYDDIGLLRLSQDAVFGKAVRPACLPTGSMPLPGKASAAGWGATEDAGSADVLQKVNLPLVSQESCRPHFDPNTNPGYRSALGRGIVDTMLCAGGEPSGTRDTCQGDSGGPLQIRNEQPYCTYTVIGVTSFGKSCATPNVPAVYSRVSSYVAWIEGIVWP